MGLMDKATDKIASTISGKEVETIQVGYEEIIELTKKVVGEAKPEELEEIEKVVEGRVLKTFKLYELKNGKYRISTHYSATLGSNGLSNKIIVFDVEQGKNYQYKTLSAGKYKKAAKNIVAEAMKNIG
ncbi:MAG: hypothetical protein LUE24_05090 [Lachnospiraceae bacterium]|nr:hypothetical protein [Lachnospiraceae bacterium]